MRRIDGIPPRRAMPAVWLTMFVMACLNGADAAARSSWLGITVASVMALLSIWYFFGTFVFSEDYKRIRAKMRDEYRD